MKIDGIINNLLVSGADDWLMAADVAWEVKSTGCASSLLGIKKVSLEIIRELLDRELVEIGDVTESGFHNWGMNIQDTMERVENRWDMLADAPGLGDVCWINLTEKGGSEAEKIMIQFK